MSAATPIVLDTRQVKCDSKCLTYRLFANFKFKNAVMEINQSKYKQDLEIIVVRLLKVGSQST